MGVEGDVVGLYACGGLASVLLWWMSLEERERRERLRDRGRYKGIEGGRAQRRDCTGGGYEPPDK